MPDCPMSISIDILPDHQIMGDPGSGAEFEFQSKCLMQADATVSLRAAYNLGVGPERVGRRLGATQAGGKSEHGRAGWWVTPTGRVGDDLVRESATENIPPMVCALEMYFGTLRCRPGKGEKVR